MAALPESIQNQKKEDAQKTVVIVAGPTAVGKTRAGIAIAEFLQTEIISADSRQCYKELEIGVARPSIAELEKVRHHFIATHSIQEEVNAAVFESYALQKTAELFERYDKILMVGGTGLYIKAFTDGLDKIPPIDPELRIHITHDYERKGMDWLKEELMQKDHVYAEKGEMKNPRRMMRALEVVEATGKSILSFRSGIKEKRGFNILKVGLELPRPVLHGHIKSRVDQMIAHGLLDEARRLLTFEGLNALQTVGYAECFDHLHGRIRLQETVDRIEINTRQYAKRQMTWFRKDPEFHWFAPGQVHEIVAYINRSTN